MAKTQTIVTTVIPRGVALNADPLPVSVFVTPRLRGADTLGAFPDWLAWTRRLAEHGLTLTLRCNGNEHDVAVDPGPLEPELWEALFTEETLVRSHQFDDYSGKPVLSYSMRRTLSVLKSIYQDAGVSLALPDDPGEGKERGNRRTLRRLLEGLDVNWSPSAGERWRDGLRRAQQAGRGPARGHDPVPCPARRRGTPAAGSECRGETRGRDPVRCLPPHADADGAGRRDAGRAARPRLGDPARLPPGAGLAQLLPVAPARARHRVRRRGAEGLRALTGPGQYAELSVAAAAGGWDWSIAPDWPGLRTACVHLGLTPETRVFFTAPRLLQNPAATVPPILGLLDLAPTRFGLAQVDVDGAMHKAIIQAETWHDPGPGRNLDPGAEPEAAAHPEVYDPEATLPSLRSGGFSLFADERALQLLGTIQQSKGFNEALESSGSQPRPFFAEDLVRGYRLDVWDSHTQAWHSLHFRDADYAVEDGPGSRRGRGRELRAARRHATRTRRGARERRPLSARGDRPLVWLEPGGRDARQASQPLRGPGQGRAAGRDDPDYRVNEPVTPFKLTTSFGIVEGTLPSLRFGRRYRLRARAVDLAGGGLQLDDPVTELLSLLFALPRDPDGSRTSATSPSRRRKS